MEQLTKRIAAHRQVLFEKTDDALAPLQTMLNAASRRAVVCWALELAEETVVLLERKHPDESRPRAALEMSRLWAMGRVKMPMAKRAILACHAAAKETEDAEDIAHYHAVGQACAAIHATGHAMGYPIYDLTALVRRTGAESCAEAVAERIAHYEEKLNRCLSDECTRQGEWAAFLK